MGHTPNQQVLLDEAARLHQSARLAQAEPLYRQVLAADPDHFMAWHMLGVLCLQLGRNQEGLLHIERALKIDPRAPDAHLHHGVALQATGQPMLALQSYERALALRPNYVSALYNRGNVLREMREPLQALAAYENVLGIEPGHVGALYNGGAALSSLGRFVEALANYDTLLAMDPNNAETHYNRGTALQELARLPEALASYDRAIQRNPNLVGAFNNSGAVLNALGRHQEALARFEQVLAMVPDHVEALNNRGTLLHRLRKFPEAMACFEKALALQPRNTDVLYNRGITLGGLNRFADALFSYDATLAIRPNHVEAMYNRGVMLQDLNRFAEARASYESTHLAAPAHPYAFGGMAGCALRLCDWERTARLTPELEARVAANRSIVSPLTFLGFSGDSALQRRCAENYLRDRIGTIPPPLWQGTRYNHEKIRLAYVSADFHQHATAHLMAGLFERHDRRRFEVIAVSLGEDDASPMRARLVKAFDAFHDVRGKSDLETARMLRAMEVDIAIDLKGHTQGSRPEIFSHRFAPVQVSYLGYPGSLGADFMDYILADASVAPMEHQAFFAEKIVHLPDSYQANDSTRPIPELTPSRAEMGLPQQGFVFCCFNNNWKITPALFDIWMRLLGVVAGSVLWLLEDSGGARENLQAAAAAHGIDPQRLVFAGRVEPDQHLARHRLADLFLDTLPYNAHTTASDALWAGLPVVTCLGSSFAGRVAASLLHATGLPDLVTTDLSAYETLALELAQNPARLRSVKERLATNRGTCPLFDTERLCRNIETAYVRMHDIAQRGDRPQAFAVTQNEPTAP